MNNWCESRQMSWDAVAEISYKFKLDFEEIPCAGPGFYEELEKIRPDWRDNSKWPSKPAAPIRR